MALPGPKRIKSERFSTVVRLLSGWLLLTCLSPPAVAADDALAPTEQAVLDNISSSAGAAKARDTVEDQITAYLQGQGLVEGVQSVNGKRVYIGTAVVSTTVNPGERGFVNARKGAYHRAYLTALGEFISSRRQEINSELYRHSLDEGSDVAAVINRLERENSPALLKRFEAVLYKVVGRIDDEPIHERDNKTGEIPVFSEAVSSRVTRHALESVSAVRLLNSFEYNNKIGIVLIHRSDEAELARQLRRGDALGGDANASINWIRERIGDLLTDEEVLLGTWGTRVIQLPDGEKVYLAFGQTGVDVGPSTSERVVDRRTEFAGRVSYNEAAAELSRYAMVTVDLHSQSESFDELVQAYNANTDELREYERIGQRLESLVQARSSLKVEGLVPVKRWRARHPLTDEPVVGTVLAWSPSLEETFGASASRRAAKDAARTKGGVDDPILIEGLESTEDW